MPFAIPAPEEQLHCWRCGRKLVKRTDNLPEPYIAFWYCSKCDTIIYRDAMHKHLIVE